MEKILIVGGVAAGATAAAKARRLSSQAEITIFEAGPDISFANCGLPYYIGGDIKNRSSLILQSPESFREQYDVTVHTNARVEKINPESRSISVSRNGTMEEHSYTKLILAQGGRPIKPTMPGSDMPHVFTLWTLADMDAIDEYIRDKDPQKAVIVGGGFIGLEMAEALAKRQLKVSVIEKMPHTMALMDAEFAAFIEEEMTAYGLELHTEKALESISESQVTLDDGSMVDADMVLLSIGVRPTLDLAIDAGLEIGEAGGLLVDEYLRTSDPHIWAAGDMVELEHRVHNQKVRIPLAGPANRQGRIAAENALGGKRAYAGSLGTSIVRVFDAVAGITGLSLKAALGLGLNAHAVTVHKEHHTSYYPGSEQVSLRIVFDKDTGKILGGQTAGFAGADRRLDVIATAAFAGLTVDDLADTDFAYSPPLGTAHDATNMAAYAAQNHISGYSTSVLAEELDDFLQNNTALIIDVRDNFAFDKGHIRGATNIPVEFLSEALGQLPAETAILLYDNCGKKGHQAARFFKTHTSSPVFYISGGFESVQRYARTIGYKNCQVILPKIETKSLTEESSTTEENYAPEEVASDIPSSGPLIIDVRTDVEFMAGAYPGAINLSLDEFAEKADQLGNKDREIILYCASGARSGYGVRVLQQMGFTNVSNGGGLMQMMRRR